MPRFPHIPTLARMAAAVLATAGLSAGVAQAASASPLTTSTTAPNNIPVAAPTSTSGSDSGSLLWNGDLSPNTFGQYAFLWACPNGVSLDPSTPYLGHVSAKFSVTDTSNQSNCPGHVFSTNPSSSLLTPMMFGNGDDRYISFATMIPAGFPYITNWFQFAEIYGPPYGGSPTVGFDISRNQMGIWRDATHNFDNPWHIAVPYGKWFDLTVHVKFSTNPAIGFVEIWLNGVQQHFTNGSTRLYYATLVPGDNWNGTSKNELDLDQYRAASPALGLVSIYHADAKVGSTLASVAP